jgi:hypothetical protein
MIAASQHTLDIYHPPLNIDIEYRALHCLVPLLSLTFPLFSHTDQTLSHLTQNPNPRISSSAPFPNLNP